VTTVPDDVERRLDQLESLVEQQQETIDRQRERIATLEQQRVDSPGRLVADGASVKVLGEIDGADATGVLGRVTGSGQTYGIRGEVTADSGYGLSTPDDAEVGGTAELAALGGGVTGEKRVTDLLGAGLAVSENSLAVEYTGVSVYLGSDQSTTGLTKVDFDNAAANPDGNFDLASATYTVPADGVYAVTFKSYTDAHLVSVRANGADGRTLATAEPPVATKTVRLTADDTVGTYVDGGGTVYGGSAETYLTIDKLG
jgi:hypothetical protein